MFGKSKELNKEQVEVLNSLIEDRFKKEKWFSYDFNPFKDESTIFEKSQRSISVLDEMIRSKQKAFNNFDKEEYEQRFNNMIFEKYVNSMIIFNTELYEARPLGMVDVGEVKKFSTPSTGNRFENGVVGYAIEQAFDDVWAKNNAQENSLNEVKVSFLKKAKALYPDCNSIFKYDADFREMGSSGNVFIYLRGTAAICKNKLMDECEVEVGKLKKERALMPIEKKLKLELDELRSKYKTLSANLERIPVKSKEIEAKLGKF
tara:strand:- start:238 stop:1020 length:783 start_codon:yes stop_codon:yes gene_type:complete